MTLSKKLNSTYLIFILLFVSIAPSSWSATYYVGNDGNDGSAGTSVETAWETLVYSCDQISAGDTLYILGGTWDEDDPQIFGTHDIGNIWLTVSGTEGNEIVIMAHPDSSRPILYGEQGVSSRYAIYIYGQDYIIFDGLEVENSWRGIRIEAVNHVVIKNCVSHHNAGPVNDNNSGFSLYYDPSTYVTVQNCTSYSNYDGALIDSSYGGQTGGITVYNNKHSVIEDNVLWDQLLGYGIRLKWKDTLCVVRNNTIYNTKYGIGLGPLSTNNSFYGNVIYDLYNGHAFFIDAGGTFLDSVDIYNNTIYNTGDAGILYFRAPLGGTYDVNSVFNNIIINSRLTGSFYNLTVQTNNHTNFYSDYNYLWNSHTNNIGYWHGTSDLTFSEWQSASGQDANSINEYPLFVDSTARDFRLRPGSPAATGGRGGDWPTYIGAFAPGCLPDPPVRISPPNGSTNLPLSLDLTWNSVGGANYYHLQVDDNSSFASPLVVDDSLVSDTSYSLSGLSGSTTYYWRLRTNDSCGWGGWNSTPWSFTTECLPLQTPLLISPDDGSSGLGQPVDFEWQDVSGASHYHIQVDTSISFTNLLINAKPLTNSLSASRLPLNISCYWKVRAVNLCGPGPWSETWSFTTTSDTSTNINLALGIIHQVDGTYSGYDSTVITDGIIYPFADTSTWASTESSISPHWIVIDFDTTYLVQQAVIYWAWNSFRSSWMTSQEIHLQYWDIDSSDYIDAEIIISSPVDSLISIEFTPQITTDTIRYFQPANMGPINYSVILWVAELEIYGLVLNSIPPTPTEDRCTGIYPSEGLSIRTEVPIFEASCEKCNQLYLFPT